MRRLLKSCEFGRATFIALAMAALAVLVAVPPGFMVSGNGQNESVRILICTGHGPVETVLDLGRSEPAKHGKGDAPCAFAVLTASAAPVLHSPLIAAPWPTRPTDRALPSSQIAIGRGLAAPPPARAPPVSLRSFARAA